MKSYSLGFISDEQIFTHVKETVEKYRYHINLAEFNHTSYFHQNMFRLAGHGWEVPKNGADGKVLKRKISVR